MVDVSALDRQIEGAFYLVVDTSFLFDLAFEELWTLRVKRLIQESATHVVVPLGVEQEYNAQLRHGGTDDYGVPIPPDSIEDLIGSERIYIYKRILDESLSRRLDAPNPNFYKTPRPLSRKSNYTPLTIIDKSVVQAVLDYSREGKIVKVASTDYGILSKVDTMSDEEKLEIHGYSPRHMPTQEAFSPLDIKYLVTGNVFGELLLEANSNDNRQRFLGIAKNIHIGGGVHYDIAFGVYTKKYIHTPSPKIDSVELLPIMFVVLDESGKSTREYYRYGFFNSYRSFVMYSDMFPTVIDFTKNEPIPYLKVKKLRAKYKNKELSFEQLLNSINIKEVDIKDGDLILVRTDNTKTLNWARIEDWHINIFDQESVGKLEYLRSKIRTYKQ